MHLSVRAAGRLLQGPSPKHTCSGIGILKRLMTWHDDPQLDGRLNFLNATRFFNRLVTAAPVHDKDLRREMHRCDS